MTNDKKKKLLVSFSGGETSAYMAWWINKHWRDKYNIIYVFANTGEEHEETLKFVHRCEKYFGIDVNWVESVFKGKGSGTKHKLVDFETASRNGEPFEEMIKKYGIPNTSYSHCTRELKLQPINHFAKAVVGWKDYLTAVGIRNDEIDRVRPKHKELGLIYPLVTNRPMTKQKVNFWWSQQPFRLNLKGYQGNCKVCWKKSDKKLWSIARENQDWFDNFKKWEEKYGDFYPDSQNRPKDQPIRFFRNHKTVNDIVSESQKLTYKISDDHQNLSYQTSLFNKDEQESCDIYAQCGD